MRQRCIRPLPSSNGCMYTKPKAVAVALHRIDAVLTHSIVGFQQSADQVGEILRPGTDKLRERIAVVVALAKKNAIRTQARLNEPRILNENALQPSDLVQGKRIFASLEDRASPSLEPVPRRSFAFDLKTRAAVGE